ncbi:hypothetical protein ACRQ5D_21435 [Mucilaginibacter sp. P25]|uniref:hypothetical protein n=1 Tax=Mucilaginibacter sp. P25 TaxID=3423945 RepID=UPI003D7BDECB
MISILNRIDLNYFAGGLVVGTAIGLALHSLAVGIAIGVAVGVSVGSRKRKGSKDSLVYSLTKVLNFVRLFID